MNADELSDIYGLKKEGNIYLAYQGPLWQQLLEDLNETIRSKLIRHDRQGCPSKYLMLFVEVVQNMVRYSSTKSNAPDGTRISHGIVITGSHNNKNFILAGNTLDPFHKSVLEGRLTDLRNKNKDELKEIFKRQLRGEVHEKAVGAGLGLIDIFRKSDDIRYDFRKTEEGEDFFSILVEFTVS